ncbi:MAG: hypothetical protein MRK01_15380 [Candidatus Scalindua sp.]|nr:hypothetical protein [Candidatus Scalindua sp.]
MLRRAHIQNSVERRYECRCPRDPSAQAICAASHLPGLYAMRVTGTGQLMIIPAGMRQQF